MVVLSTAIIASGKTLLARQFVEMTRLRVEGLLSAFPKLVDSGKDHTFIETETVRYVYQPMESLYLVMVTNKSSNILEDIETLRLLAKVVQDNCQVQVNEEAVSKHAFDIIFAFDEVISFGYRESVTLSQIKTYTEMDSHEEKLHQMLEQSKVNEAKEQAKKRATELSKIHAQEKKEAAKEMAKDLSSSLPSLGSGMGSSGMGSSMSAPDPGPSSPPWASMMEDTGPAALKPAAPKKGMVLGKKKPGDIFAGLGASDPAPAAAEPAAAAAVEEEAPAPVVNPLLEPVKVEIDETVKAKLQLEGGLEGEAECVGAFSVTVLDTAKADLVCFKLENVDKEFKYKVHPNLNKASFDQNVLEVRDPSRAFRANQAAPLVKWRAASTKEAFLPISLSCWPQVNPDSTQMVLEFELTDDSVSLEDVKICFPAAPQSRPQIQSAEPGEAVYDPAGQVVWQIPVIDSSDNSGTLEFTASTDQASLLPYTFTAVRRAKTKCPMEIIGCYHQSSQEKIDFAIEKSSIYTFEVGA
mmetsp:Transcript_57138/g.107750  ORF Transcript_57138/g.107750 Transcript_57138/m.107750 type:complete len:524 (+) Transcript_57138:132-1703(+)